MNRSVSFILLLGTFALLTPGCIPGDGSSTQAQPAGFLSGIWHGWIAPLSLVWGILDPSIRVYESVNTGWWYDFGFYIAIIAGFGSLSLVRHKQKENAA